MRDSSYFPRVSRPGMVRREMQRNQQEKKRQGPPAPPKRKGPELRGPNNKLQRALVQRAKKFTPCLGCPTPRRCTAAGKCFKGFK